MVSERFMMVLLCAACSCLNYADRVNVSVAIIAIAEQYALTIEQQSAVLSAFFLGYLPMQLGGAVLCRRAGAKRVLALGAAGWSLFTALTPAAAAMGYSTLLVCRVAMGLTEGVAFPSVYHFLAGWIPANERGRAISVFLTGVHVGTAIALIFSPIIIRTSSWQTIFYVFGSSGVVWIALWCAIAYDKDPKKDSGQPESDVSETELAILPVSNGISPNSSSDGLSRGLTKRESRETLVLQGDADGMGPPPVSRDLLTQGLALFMAPGEVKGLSFILRSRPCMAICITQFFHNFTHYTILSWLPTYFKQVYGIKTGSLSITFLPYAAMALASNLGGFLADSLLTRGLPLTRVRKLVTAVSNTGAAVCIVAFAMAETVPMALLFIALSLSFQSLNTGGFESSYLDVAQSSLAGLFKSVANTLGALSGMLAIRLSTLILRWSDGSWRVMFASLAVWHCIGALIFTTYATSDRILVEDVRGQTKTIPEC